MNGSLIALVDNADVTTNDTVVAKNVLDTLHKHYPGHRWAVECDGQKGVCNIFCGELSMQWGYVLKLSRLFGDTEYTCVVKAGGELLERWRQRRGQMIPDHVEAAPQLANGFPVFDPGSAKSKVPRHFKFAWQKSS